MVTAQQIRARFGTRLKGLGNDLVIEYSRGYRDQNGETMVEKKRVSQPLRFELASGPLPL